MSNSPFPIPEVLTALLDSWEENRKTARIIMLLDVSGSMADLTSTGDTKLELAKQAVLSGLDSFKPEDEIGLWIFSTNLDGDNDYQELIPPAPLGDIRRGVRGHRQRADRRRRHRPL